MDDEIYELDPESDEMVRLYTAIGRLVSTCTGLEHAMELMHETLVRTPLWQIMTGEGFETARQGSLHAARYIGGETESRVSEVCRDAKAVWDKRGEIVHGHHMPASLKGGPEDTYLITRSRRSGTSSQSEWTLQEIADLEDRVSEVWVSVEELYLSLPKAETLPRGNRADA